MSNQAQDSLQYCRTRIKTLEHTLERQRQQINSLQLIIGKEKLKVPQQLLPIHKIMQQTIEEQIGSSIDYKSRRTEVVQGRRMYYALMRERTIYSLNAISRTLLINQDHSTVIHAINTHNDLMRFNKPYIREVANMIELIEEAMKQQILLDESKEV
jgi:chromosomal replication initiation ATPase DnaA